MVFILLYCCHFFLRILFLASPTSPPELSMSLVYTIVGLSCVVFVCLIMATGVIICVWCINNDRHKVYIILFPNAFINFDPAHFDKHPMYIFINLSQIIFSIQMGQSSKGCIIKKVLCIIMTIIT